MRGSANLLRRRVWCGVAEAEFAVSALAPAIERATGDAAGIAEALAYDRPVGGRADLLRRRVLRAVAEAELALIVVSPAIELAARDTAGGGVALADGGPGTERSADLLRRGLLAGIADSVLPGTVISPAIERTAGNAAGIGAAHAYGGPARRHADLLRRIVLGGVAKAELTVIVMSPAVERAAVDAASGQVPVGIALADSGPVGEGTDPLRHNRPTGVAEAILAATVVSPAIELAASNGTAVLTALGRGGAGRSAQRHRRSAAARSWADDSRDGPGLRLRRCREVGRGLARACKRDRRVGWRKGVAGVGRRHGVGSVGQTGEAVASRGVRRGAGAGRSAQRHRRSAPTRGWADGSRDGPGLQRRREVGRGLARS